MVKPVRAAIFTVLFAGGLAMRAGAAAPDATPPFPTSTDEGSAMLWLKDNTSLGVGRFVAFSPDNVLVVLTDESSAKSPTIHKVSFRQEATKVDFVARTGGRSLRGSGDINCATGSFRAESVELFSGTDLRGDRIVGEGPDSSGRVPRAGTAPALAIAQVCSGKPSAYAPLATATAVQRTTPAPASSRLEPRAAPVDEPTPLPPPRETPPPPPPRPEPAAVPAEAAAPGVLAQIGAFATRDAAERAWNRLAESFPDVMSGKTMRIDPVTVNGMPMFRSAIAGFTGKSEAQALCNRLMASSETCFVRNGP